MSVLKTAPWFVENTMMGVRVVYGEPDGDGLGYRSDVPGIGRVGDPSNPDAIALAHLLAAAPDLLEACKEAFPFIDTIAREHAGMLGGIASGAALAMLKSAIAKAEGRS